MSNESAWLLMRAEARGLSGTFTPSTPTDFRNRAPSTSLLTSIPLGGTISTIVAYSPAASLAPKGERFSSGTAAIGGGAGWLVLVRAAAVLPRASPTRRADFM